MRTKNSARNVIVVIILNIITIVVGFISQKIFINILGIEYLGINGLFSNILSVLGIVELGLGSAIVYHLYKPLSENDKESVKSLISFYKTGYRIVALIVGIIGVFITLFLKYIVGEISVSENITYIYLLCLIDIVVSYLLTYKRSILYASQKTYVVNIVHIGYLIIMNIVQLYSLMLTKNYILYLWIKIIFRILENLVITFISNKMYPFLKEKNVSPINKKLFKDIFVKLKGLLFHKIGTFIVLGTDNILISVFLGIKIVGLYDNYYLIFSKTQNLFSQIFNSITASVGNLLIENNSLKSYKIYKNMLFINSWIFMVVSAVIFCVMEPFISFWLGSQYLLSIDVLIVLVINFYIQGLRLTSLTFKNADGVFYEDRMMPLLEAITNIIASIIFVKIFGLAGIFLGTISSTIILFIYGYYKFVYKKIFGRNYLEYIIDYLPYFLFPCVSIIFSYLITKRLLFSNIIIQIFSNAIIAFIISNLLYLVLFYKTDEFKYFVEIFKKIFLSKFILNFKKGD